MSAHSITPSATKPLPPTPRAALPLAPLVEQAGAIAARFYLDLPDRHVLRYDAPVPFLPVVGMTIDPGSGDAFEVTRVHYFCRDRVLDVDLSDEVIGRSLAFYLRHGWQIEEKPE